MRDPEREELPAEPTQRSRSVTASTSPGLPEEDAEELTDDDLIDDGEELSADDLIEGESELTSPAVAGAGTEPGLDGLAALPARAEVESPSFSALARHDGAPPVAPPPAGLKSRPPLAAAQPQEEPAAPAPAPTATTPVAAAPQVREEPKPFLEPPPQWVRSGEPTAQYAVGDDIYLLVRADDETLAAIRGDKADLWVQLHLLETYPLITLSLVLDTEADEPRALHWHLDIEEDYDRRLLQSLRRRFVANVILFDVSYSLVGEVVFEAPREVNVARVVDGATQHLGEIGPGRISPVEARRVFRSGEWDWAGKKKHPFAEDAYAEIGSLAEAKLALGILVYWSESQNQDYLVMTKSIPVDVLDTITRRILDGAIRYGLWLPQALKERAIALALATDAASLTARQIAAFAAHGEAPPGLDPGDVAESWQRLLRDADELDVQVGKETLALAESIVERVNSTDEREEHDVAPPSKEAIEALPDAAVVTLLERRATRKVAALVLASRGSLEHLDVLFRAARKMGRLDLVAVVPALLSFGEAGGDFFIEGLAARKSFTRQACAIALGELKLRRAVVPLLHQLVAEKTTVWYEIARALGRYGPAGVKPLHRYLRDPRGKEDRLVRAMASFAIHGAAKQVESIASGDSAGAALARQALEAREAVRAAEEQVQGRGEVDPQATMLRFSRRLYQSIAGEAQGPDDELLEELGDSDIMEVDDGEE
jgi:hypothetical protein